MKVQGAGNQQAWQIFKTKQEVPKDNANKEWKSPDSAATKAESQTTEAGSESPETRGVIRLLQEGHFRGVADLRLRINFYEELQQASAAEAGKAISEAGKPLLIGLQEQVTALDDAFDLSDQLPNLLKEVEGVIKPLLSETAVSQSDATSLFDEVEKAFANLLSSLQDAFKPTSSTELPTTEQNIPDITANPEVGSDANLIAAAETTSEEPTTADPFADALADLQTWFGDQLSSIKKMATESFALPTISEPHGNGVAYNRFLEMLNSLQGSATENAAGQGSSDSLEIEA